MCSNHNLPLEDGCMPQREQGRHNLGTLWISTKRALKLSCGTLGRLWSPTP